jgi:4-hydroxyproline epimerase
MTPHQRIRVIDSHTAGEPTRLILAGGPELGDGSLERRLETFRRDYDAFRSAVVNEPRGSDIIVGALLCEPVDPHSTAGVIFFNNVGYLGMCGHGTIGLIATLSHLGKIEPGEHRIETPVGTVVATLHADGRVTVHNLPSRRSAARVTVQVPGYGAFCGDVAWGGNWFYLVEEQPYTVAIDNVEELTAVTWAIRQALSANGITGDDGKEIDHIELFGPPSGPEADSRNFVLCPGKAYDRSPCGTGTSAKLACLYAKGKLRPGQVWRQQGILGSIFEGSFNVRDGNVYPSITGRAYITAETDLVFDKNDPSCMGLVP